MNNKYKNKLKFKNKFIDELKLKKKIFIIEYIIKILSFYERK
jgi:hypothetical protein